MKTNDKTLADVKPGGMVRLKDALPPLPPEVDAVRCMIRGEKDLAEACDYYYTAEQMRDYARAALSAQPSPGGQGDALDEVACDLPALFGRASLEGHEVGQRLAKEVQAKMRAALAARQPVGEPVARSIIEEFVQCADVGRPPGKLLAQARDYLAAPPAPAVDLERFRPAVMTALGLSSPYGLERETLNELLDLIDGKGVGK
ncbi:MULTISPECIES: hypothetical protein [Stenotrophomonas maltophilia group]|uniref:hypothetical protein n=1 Tax=Stenotrophomonas maltophilia group TaxID=995085 RepID=UPI0020919540|nr:hypothetical protein [Stenotrophomonas maltophilia]MCO5736901.1 hypothetical protein [Stenotrophomonas maltophilia]